MAYNPRNIIVGAAALFISAKDSTDPAWLATSSAAATSTSEAVVNGQGGPSLPIVTSGSIVAGFLANTADWRHMGLTSDGITLEYSPTYGEVAVDQLLDVAKLFKSAMTMTVGTSLTESTLENLLVAWGQSSTTLSGGTLGMSSGQLGDDPVERSLAFIGPGPRGSDNQKRERIYLARRALQVEASSYALSRDTATMIPVSFRLLPDPLFVNAEYGLIRDRVIS